MTFCDECAPGLTCQFCEPGADPVTAAVPDPREPKPCPRCGTVCAHDGWGHVHPNGIGIGSCAVPDPRFRDQLAKTLAAHEITRGWPGGVDCRCGWFGRGVDHAAHRANAVAAEAEARVQAAANQREAEAWREAAVACERIGVPAQAIAFRACAAALDPICPRCASPYPGACERSACPRRAAALASPVPAPRAEEGP